MSALAEFKKSRHCLMELINRPSIPFDKSARLEPISLVWMEHSYARAWRGSGGASGGGGLAGGGARTLLVRRAPRCPDCHGEDHNIHEIDIETVDKDPEPPIPREETPPLEKALTENEIEAWSDKEGDWEEKLENLAPTTAHHRLLTNTLECIKGLRMMRLSGAPRGADYFARKFRRALSSVWGFTGQSSSHTQQQRPATWLHAALTAYLPKAYLDCYIDLVAILKTKIPTLMEQMLAGHHFTIPPVPRPATEQLVALNPDDDGPLLVFIPSGREVKDTRWAERFKAVLPVVRVSYNLNSSGKTVAGMAATAVAAGRSKVLSLLSQKPNRRLVLVGHGVGALFAAQVAVSVGTGSSHSLDTSVGNVTPVTGVVGLGLLAPPLLTWAGRRSMPDDCLLDLNCPTLIVVGQNAMQCDVEEAEALRSRLRMWSRLVVVGAADDQLRLDYFKCTLEKVTQEMVECALADEMAMFVKSACQWAECPTPPNPPAPPAPQAMLGFNEHQSHNGEELRSTNRRRAACASNSPPHVKRQKQSDQSTTPTKGRGVALYKVNNPPPEIVTLSMGQMRSAKGSDEDLMLPAKQITSPPNKLRVDSSNIQIPNNRIIRKLSDSSTGTSSGKSGIKLLDNICIVGTGGRNSLPIKLPSQRLSLIPSPAIDTSLQSPTPLTSTNIMDIPIIFADDEKQIVNMQPTQVITPTISIVSTNVTTPAMPILVTSSTPLSNHTISVKRSNLSTPIKYSKVILAKRPSTTPDAVTTTAGIVTTTVSNTTPVGGKILGRPIIVRGRSGHLTAFRVMPGNAAGLVIKRANVITAPNIKSVTSIPVKTESGDQKTESAKEDDSGVISRSETEQATQAIEKQTEAMSENVDS